MSEEAASDRPNWPACCHFMQLFRAWKIALRFSALALAFCGIFSTYITGRVLDGIWAAESSPVVTRAGETELDHFIATGSRAETKTWIDAEAKDKKVPRAGVFQLMMRHGRMSVNSTTAAVLSLSPARTIGAIGAGLMGFAWMTLLHPGYAILFTFITLSIWCIFGGAVARVAALHATRDERIGFKDALNFARTKCGSFFFAPLMPIGAILIGMLLIALVALILSWIPALGEILIGLLLLPAILGGIVLAFLIIGGIVGYPLTYPTIAVEGSDAFDAFSRTFSYVYQRPWRTAFYAGLSLIYGAICLLFVKFFARLALWAMHVSIGLTMNWFTPYMAEAPATPPGKLDAIWQAPSLSGENPFYGSFDASNQLTGGSWFAQVLFKVWIYSTWGLIAAIFVSLFYSSSTLIYLLLRKHVDATDMEEVFTEDQMVDDTIAPAPAPAVPAAGGTSLPIMGQGS